MITMDGHTSPRQLIYYYGKADTSERNPIARLNKGFKKGKFYQKEHTCHHHPQLQCDPQTEEEQRFSSLSANK